MKAKQILLMSSSAVHGFGYLEHSKNDIVKFLNKNKVKSILFIPFALKNHDDYLRKVDSVLSLWGYSCDGLHTKTDQIDAINKAESIFIGGGNTFRLLKTLYDNKLIEAIRKRVLNDGVPYMGSSAGTNVATLSINTTNDMPIVFPPSFEALGLVKFNINPHYMDPDVSSKHKGETRELRISEYHEVSDTPVLGLREGTSLLVDGDKATLIGSFNARLFQAGKTPIEYEPNSDLSFLLF
uniref:dipeptidase E n=1 Tax=Corethrella appendiculata TaxID=1370023 RepID=U5EYH1_9DIPT